MYKYLQTIFITLVLSNSTFASDGWAGSIGIVNNDYGSGSNMTVGYFVERDDFRADFNLVDLNMFSAETEGYHTEKLSNGNEICRDESSGQFSDDGNCSALEIDYALSLESGYMIRKFSFPLLVGIGSRIGGDKQLGAKSEIYFNFQLSDAAEKWFGKVRFGSEYSLFSLGVQY